MADSKGRILVVDPDVGGADELAELIGSSGNQVFTARTSDEGLRKFWDILPDLVFADVLRLGEGGERMCRELKRTDYGAITPLVVHSQRHATLTRVEVMRAFGAVDYVVKPFQESKVRALLDWALSARDESNQPTAHEVLDRFTLSADSEGAVSLESGSLPYLLGRAEEEKRSGILLLIAGGHKTVLLLEEGLIVGASSNAPAEQLERVLLSMRKLTPAQLADVKSKTQNGRDLFPLLSFLGLLRPEERKEVLRYQALTVGLTMFRLLTGVLQFRRGESVECLRLETGIRPTTLALIGLRKNPALLTRVTERFVRDAVVFLQPSASSRVTTRTLPLSRFERTVLGSVDGERSVKDLRELGRLAQLDLDEPLAVLAGSGILKPSSAQPQAASASVSASTPLRAEPSSKPQHATPSSGSLEKVPFVDLLGSLLREGASGTLTVESSTSRTFSLANHEIVHARSSKPEDSLGRLLVTDRVISREALDRALTLQRRLPDRRLGSLLVEMHELTPDSLLNGLRQQILRLVEDTFGWQFGHFSFVADDAQPEWSVKLDTELLALLRRGTCSMSHAQLRARWPRLRASLVADAEIADTAMLTNPERELYARACVPGGVAFATSDLSLLRRAHLLVVGGFCHIAGEAAHGSAAEEVAVEAPLADARKHGGGPGGPGGGHAADGKHKPAATPVVEERSDQVRFDIVSYPEPAGRREPSHDPTGALIAFLRDELVVDKRALDERLRATEMELRQAMEEIGRLRERTRTLDLENRVLRERAGIVGTVGSAGGPDASASTSASDSLAGARGRSSAPDAPTAIDDGAAAAAAALAAGTAVTPVTWEPGDAGPAPKPAPARKRTRSAKKKQPAASKPASVFRSKRSRSVAVVTAAPPPQARLEETEFNTPRAVVSRTEHEHEPDAERTTGGDDEGHQRKVADIA